MGVNNEEVSPEDGPKCDPSRKRPKLAQEVPSVSLFCALQSQMVRNVIKVGPTKKIVFKAKGSRFRVIEYL